MPTHDIVVIGASAGGIEALIDFVAHLPPQLPAALFVVVHIPAQAHSALPHILMNAGSLPAHAATDGMAILPGHIYVAPPDYHLLVVPDQMRVVRGPREHSCRPAIDPLFRTAALAFGPRVVGIVLSGALNDGTAGLLAIKQQGGIAMVQDPETALFPSMPQSALSYVAVDWCLKVPDLSAKVTQLAEESISMPEEIVPVSRELKFEAKIAGLDPTVLDQEDRPGILSAFSCPDCSGPLWEHHDGPLHRFRCRVGHAFTLETMMAGREENIETTLWMVLNALDETAQMYTRLAASTLARHQDNVAQTLSAKAHRFQERAHQVREMLLATDDRVLPEVPLVHDGPRATGREA